MPQPRLPRRRRHSRVPSVFIRHKLPPPTVYPSANHGIRMACGSGGGALELRCGFDVPCGGLDATVACDIEIHAVAGAPAGYRTPSLGRSRLRISAGSRVHRRSLPPPVPVSLFLWPCERGQPVRRIVRGCALCPRAPSLPATSGALALLVPPWWPLRSAPPTILEGVSAPVLSENKKARHRLLLPGLPSLASICPRLRSALLVR